LDTEGKTFCTVLYIKSINVFIKYSFYDATKVSDFNRQCLLIIDILKTTIKLLNRVIHEIDTSKGVERVGTMIVNAKC
jgi:hypothetical protein